MFQPELVGGGYSYTPSLPFNATNINNQIITNFSSTIFTKNLSLLNQGNEVKDLQKLLNILGFTVSKTGPGSPGNETNKFGGFTREALKALQRSAGITPAVGYFGPVTRQYVNNLIKTIKANKNFPAG